MDTVSNTSRRAKRPRHIADCPLTAALGAIGGKWKLICPYWLERKPCRFNELQRLLPGITHKMLSLTLRELERDGLVSRVVQVPLQVEYSLTEYGATVRSLIEATRQWGRQHLNRPR